ncbi:MAG TPA: NUDIX hydrolase [bacterium]|nr:NUDIX hydrolase [bacterium]
MSEDPGEAKKQYRNPTPTVDVLIELDGGIVVIERRNPPHGWAIPGGFVDEGEPTEAAALREMMEETNLDVVLSELFYVYSDPRRDPRQHTLTTVYIGKPRDARARPVAGDDAGNVKIVDPADPQVPLAFDHGMVLAHYAHYRKTGKRPDPMVELERWRTRAPLR